MKVEIYSDIACPWCYIGERRFAAALASFDEPGVEVVFRPYQLDPGAPATPRPLITALREKFGANVSQMLARVSDAAREEGIEMRWDRAVAVNTLTAHRLLRLALHEHGPEVQRALAERLFEAHFSNGGDVGDVALLTELAAAAGMDRERTHAWLESGDGLAETRAEIAQAQEIGVRAVPTFVFDQQYVVEGGQPSAVFSEVLREVARLASGGDATLRA
jgi:predicted DsbA family dithiol-disulfide isomerase